MNDESRKGYPVWQDYIAGTDPTNAASRFQIIHADFSDSHVVLTWDPDCGDSNRVYKVYSNTNMASTNWVLFDGPVGSGAPVESDGSRFFRVTVELP